MIKTLTETSDVLFSIMITSSNDEPKQVPLEYPELLIGKSKEADVMVNDTQVGDLQIKIIREGERFQVCDLNSGFPTRLNNQILESPFPLVAGDIITMGKTQIHFMERSASEEIPKEKPKEADAGKTQFMTVFKVEEEKAKGRLVGVSGQVKGRVFPINKDKISIGRDPSNDICIDQDGLSRAHAILEIGEKTITVLDFNSTNGTFINGKKIVSEVIKPGTVVQFANAALRYELFDSSDDKGKKSFFRHFVQWTVTLMLVTFITGGGIYLFNYYSTEKQKRILEQKQKELENLAEKVKEESPEKKLEIAEKACSLEQYDEAMKIVDGVLSDSPSHAGALLLKGKIMKAKKYAEVNELYQKGLRYYEANEFNKARGTLQMIEADFEKYEEIKDLLEKIDQIPAVEVSYSMANDHFKAGDLDKTKEMLYSILKMIPVYKKALDLKSLIEEMEQLIKAMNEAETRKDPQAVIEALKKILEKVPNPDNYYNQFAYKKMKDLTTGKNLRAELNYVSGIEAMAQWKYAAAYEYFKKAYASDPDSVKIKIALSESKQKRLKILQTCYPASLIVEKENPAKAKILWKKIIDLGPEGNEYYEKAIKKLEG